VTAFVVEAADPTRALRFTLSDGTLATETIDLTKLATPPQPIIEWKGRKR